MPYSYQHKTGKLYADGKFVFFVLVFDLHDGNWGPFYFISSSVSVGVVSASFISGSGGFVARCQRCALNPRDSDRAGQVRDAPCCNEQAGQ